MDNRREEFTECYQGKNTINAFKLEWHLEHNQIAKITCKIYVIFPWKHDQGYRLVCTIYQEGCNGWIPSPHVLFEKVEFEEISGEYLEDILDVIKYVHDDCYVENGEIQWCPQRDLNPRCLLEREPYGK